MQKARLQDRKQSAGRGAVLSVRSRVQVTRKHFAPCRAILADPAFLATHEFQFVQQIAREEVVLEANLHASSLTVMQCLASYGYPRHSPALVDRVVEAGATTPIAAFLSTPQQDADADLAVCLATPSTSGAEEARASERQEQRSGVEEDTVFEVMAPESGAGGNSQWQNALIRMRRSRQGNLLVKLGAMLPACPFTGRRLVSVMQA